MNEIQNFLKENRKSTLDQWLTHAFKMYPEQSRMLMMNNPDPFTSPISHALSKGMALLLDRLCGEETTAVEKSLEDLGRLLAVQEIPPSQSLAFIFGLKTVIRQLARKKRKHSGFSDKDWDEFQNRLEQTLLSLFDCYLKHREKIYQLKAEEMKQRTYMLLRRATR